MRGLGFEAPPHTPSHTPQAPLEHPSSTPHALTPPPRPRRGGLGCVEGGLRVHEGCARGARGVRGGLVHPSSTPSSTRARGGRAPLEHPSCTPLCTRGCSSVTRGARGVLEGCTRGGPPPSPRYEERQSYDDNGRHTDRRSKVRAGPSGERVSERVNGIDGGNMAHAWAAFRSRPVLRRVPGAQRARVGSRPCVDQAPRCH